MDNNNFVKVGIIGCGGMSKSYKFFSKFVKNTKIVAGTDNILERAIKIGGKNHAYTDVDEMYKNENVDVVYIATPHNLHKPMIQKALEEGKHVFCEKPVAISVEEAREIYKLEKKYNRLKIGFNYQYRYDRDCQRLAKGVQNDHLGKIFYANCNIFFSRELDYFDKGPWRSKKDTAGGGTLLIHGSHIIDVLIWALGEPISVMGKIDRIKFKEIDVEDVGLGIVEFANGALVQINDSMLVKPRMRKFEDKVELLMFGEKGRCFYSGPWPFSSLKWFGVKKFNVKKEVKAYSHYGRCIKAFANWVLYDTPFYNTVEESSKVLSLISALYKSSETGKKEKVEKL